MQTLIMGNRDGIDDFSSTNASVLLSVLKLIDEHDLYGQVAYPKHHKQSDVPDIYCFAAKTKVFIIVYMSKDKVIHYIRKSETLWKSFTKIILCSFNLCNYFFWLCILSHASVFRLCLFLSIAKHFLFPLSCHFH